MEDLLNAIIEPLSGILTQRNLPKKIDLLEESAKKEMIEKITSGYAAGLEGNIKDLASKLRLLIEGSADFTTRLLSVPMAIMSVTPVGPGVSPNLILPLIMELRGEAKNLAAIYDEAETALDAVVPDDTGNQTIDNSKKGIKTLMKSAAVLCALVGVKCGKEEAKDTSAYEKSPMSTEAKDCEKYTPDSSHTNTSTYPANPEYCTRFEGMMSLDDFVTDDIGTKEDKYNDWLQKNRKCSSCKNFKKR